MNNRKSPIKQQRTKNSHSVPVANCNSNRMRSNSSMGSSYQRNHSNPHFRHYSNTTSPVAMSASSLPAVPMFYTDTYADPPECSSLPQPPESWYLPSAKENLPTVPLEEKVQEKPKAKAKPKASPRNQNKRFYSPFYPSRSQPQWIAVKA